jgi:hypothetical protein
MPGRSIMAILALAVVLAGCSTTNESNPPRSATEELIISGAADRAAAQLDLAIPKGTRIFLDATRFDATTFDGKYALGRIEDQLVRDGARPVAERKDADMVVAVRAGALSMDTEQFLIGIPKIEIPIPLAGTFGLPEIALYKERTRSGIAKFAATAYPANKDLPASFTDPKFGVANEREWTVLLFIGWKTSDVSIDERESSLSVTAPSVPTLNRAPPTAPGITMPGVSPTPSPNFFP